ncbi:MAG: glycosyltransferase [Armatimonadota bacterium]
MRILFLTDRFPPQIGGVAVSSARLAQGLAARGHVVHVAGLNAGVEAGAVQSETTDGVVIHRLGALEEPDLALQLADRVIAHLHERVRFELFHGHGVSPAGYLAAYFARRFGAASYVSVRGNDVDRGMFNPAQLPFVLWALEHADAVGCVSRELAEKARALSGREADYTPNSVDTTLFRPKTPNPALLEPFGDVPLLGFVGELRFKKGTNFLLDAFRVVRAARPAKLLLIGGLRGEDRSFLRHYLRQYPDLRPDIHVIDYLHDRGQLVDYYNLLDLVLVPSLWDGMPNSLLEAMACGRVTISGDAGGIRDVVRHGETGFLVGIHELHRLGEGCLEVLAAGGKLRQEIGERARRYVETHHAPELELARLEEAYRRCIHPR